MEQENAKYISKKLKGVIEPMIAQIVLKRPENVAQFMLDYLKTTFNRSEPADKGAGSEHEKSSDEVFFG